MTESAVRVIVMDAFDKYEKETGLPRHTENLGNFTTLFAAINKARGAVTTLQWLVTAAALIIGLPAAVLALVELARFARGH